MDDYPKVIEVDGIKITAISAEDEANWRKKPSNPLDDVTIEMENPAYQDPEKPSEQYDIVTDTTETVVEPEPEPSHAKPKKKAPKKK